VIDSILYFSSGEELDGNSSPSTTDVSSKYYIPGRDIV
jgi:hypothetical protein